jgi:hypothetical protein
MTDLPFHLLQSLASRDEQVRHINGAAKDEYLVPEDLLNDAHHFCERVQHPGVWATLDDHQKRSVEVLKAMIEVFPDEVLASTTIIDDPSWLAVADQSRSALAAFGQNAP